ncbi:fungal-specific transcription factor domain-containing protein [Thelonectria olida]|uniref:Fungal-specific transcription factor domain-containing protein n=1 Tax=Thelonectria olida TaxID=1576542 RepID=A0A9P9AI10_9HYPO|nr:fungal-specific transcription factor domain-containing protein [Thelonectria olida]
MLTEHANRNDNDIFYFKGFFNGTELTRSRIDSVVNAYLIQSGDLNPTSSSQRGLVAHSHTDYFSPMSFPAIAELGLRINHIGKSSVSYEVGVFTRGAEAISEWDEDVYPGRLGENLGPQRPVQAVAFRRSKSRLIHPFLVLMYPRFPASWEMRSSDDDRAARRNSSGERRGINSRRKPSPSSQENEWYNPCPIKRTRARNVYLGQRLCRCDAMDEASADRTVKRKFSSRRAPRACLSCRKRKVRCDVTRTAQPCTNCRLDDTTCVLDVRAPASACRDRVTTTKPASDAASTSDDYFCSHVSSEALDSTHCDSSNVDNDSHFVAPSPGNPNSDQANWKRLETTDGAYCNVEYLESQGCFRVPTEPILDEFLQHYFLHVHPMLPILNEGDFWNDHSANAILTSTKQPPGPPLLLLQAVLFSSCAFISQETSQALGFNNIREAKASFYAKSKLLYDSSMELDHVSMARASLLLTYWCPSLGSGRKNANSTWLSVAIFHAKAAGAHQYATLVSDSGFSSPQQRKHQNVMKRLWWCCVIRDRIMPLCVRRHTQITRTDFDFTSHTPLDSADLSDEVECSRVYKTDVKRSIITIMAMMTELSVCLTDILDLVYPTVDLPGLDAPASSKRLIQVYDCKRALERWADRAIASSPAIARSAQRDHHHHHSSNDDSIVLFANLLWIYYHSARVALCNYELRLAVMSAVVTSHGSTWAQLATIATNRSELWDAATAITECLDRLLQLRLARWLPTITHPCIPLETLPSSSRRSQKQNRLNILIQAMREYRLRYDGVDWISKTIRYFMECTYLDGPMASYWDPIVSKNRTWVENHNGASADILVKNPTYYLKMALTLDLSLSQDRLPEEKDFPVKLRGLIRRTGCFMPILFGHGGINDIAAGEGFACQQDSVMSPPSSPLLQDIAGWIENDRSLYFAQELGLGPDLTV